MAISARHIHLDQRRVERLFGPGHELTPQAPLSQPDQYACEETLTIIGPKRRLEHVRVLGPARRRNQSGDVDNSPGVTLEGPEGRITLPEGLICAARHIHMNPADAKAFHISDGDVVEVAIDSQGRDLIFGDVLIRVSPHYQLEMHVDTDEANAAELTRKSEGMLVMSSGQARLRRRELRPAPS